MSQQNYLRQENKGKIKLGMFQNKYMTNA